MNSKISAMYIFKSAKFFTCIGGAKMWIINFYLQIGLWNNQIFKWVSIDKCFAYLDVPS